MSDVAHAPVWAGSIDRHAAPASTDPLTRPQPRFSYAPDPIELACPACALEKREGRWHHDRACPLRQPS